MRNVSIQLVRLLLASYTFLAYAAGITLVAAGAWLITPAAGLIVGGAALTATAVMYEIRPRAGA